MHAFIQTHTTSQTLDFHDKFQAYRFLLFSIFINDLPHVVKNADVIMYADDFTLFCGLPTLVELRENLHFDYTALLNR